MAEEFDWNETALAKLRALWAEGISASEIGRRIGASKNSVIGKSNRLHLPARPSPIRRGDGAAAAKPRVERLGEAPSVNTVSSIVGIERIRNAAREPEPVVRVERVFAGGVKPCAWPIGTPRTASFHFCGGNSLPAGPYCEDHAAIAYVRVRDRREDAA